MTLPNTQTRPIGEKATIAFNYDGVDRCVAVRLKLSALTRGDGKTRKVIFLCNHNVPHEIEVGESITDIDLSIETCECFDHGNRSVVVELVVPDVFSPCELGLSTDERQLGVYLREILIADSAEDLLKLDAPQLDRPEPGESASGLTTPTAANNVPSHLPGISASERLAIALQRLDVPQRLPSRNPVFRLLRVGGFDRLALKLYGKLFGRTHDSIRRVIDVLRNPDA